MKKIIYFITSLFLIFLVGVSFAKSPPNDFVKTNYSYKKETATAFRFLRKDAKANSKSQSTIRIAKNHFIYRQYI